MDKQKILDAYIQFLDRKIKDIEKSVNSLIEGVDTAPGPMQSRSDTTRFQQSGVALEVATRLSSLKTTRAFIAFMRPKKSVTPEIGVLIIIEDAEFKDREYYFVVPYGGGESIKFDEIEILFISIQAPILEAISKIKIGDPFEFRGRRLTLLELL